MPKVSDLFFKTAIVWLILGIGAGLQMAISGDHGAFPAHAHINLLGWVTSAIFGGYYALNPAKAARRTAMVHYGLYNVGLVVSKRCCRHHESNNPKLVHNCSWGAWCTGNLLKEFLRAAGVW